MVVFMSEAFSRATARQHTYRILSYIDIFILAKHLVQWTPRPSTMLLCRAQKLVQLNVWLCVCVCVVGGGGGRGEGSINDMCTVNNLSANSSIKGDDININGDLIRYSTKWSSPP